MSRLFLFLVLAQMALSPQTAAATDAYREAYFRALDKRIPKDHRAKWDAVVAREGVDKVATAYYVFGEGACKRLRDGERETILIANFAQSFGDLSAAVVGAARETICPEVPVKP